MNTGNSLTFQLPFNYPFLLLFNYLSITPFSYFSNSNSNCIQATEVSTQVILLLFSYHFSYHFSYFSPYPIPLPFLLLTPFSCLFLIQFPYLSLAFTSPFSYFSLTSFSYLSLTFPLPHSLTFLLLFPYPILWFLQFHFYFQYFLSNILFGLLLWVVYSLCLTQISSEDHKDRHLESATHGLAAMSTPQPHMVTFIGFQRIKGLEYTRKHWHQLGGTHNVIFVKMYFWLRRIEIAIWGKSRVKCPKCNVTFSRTASMTRHLNTKHRETPPKYTCDICDKEFPAKSNLDRHRSLVHGGQKEYKGNECPAEYGQKRDLEKHIEKGNHFREYECKFCKQTLVFKSYEQEQRHLIHTKNGISYTCRYRRYGKK